LRGASRHNDRNSFMWKRGWWHDPTFTSPA